jgi:hypothetical protein
VQKLTGGAQRPVSRVENIENDWRVWWKKCNYPSGVTQLFIEI